MIYTDQTPVAFQDVLPESVDVVIIGGGVIGISTAWFLATQGISVLVCEKGRVAGEQSSRNWGWIRQQARDPAELPIAIYSINSWEALSRELDTDIGFTRKIGNSTGLFHGQVWYGFSASARPATLVLGVNGGIPTGRCACP